jgi:hypothetical protein
MTKNKQVKKSKYSSLDEWKLADPLAYKIAVNLIPEICKTFGWESPFENTLTSIKELYEALNSKDIEIGETDGISFIQVVFTREELEIELKEVMEFKTIFKEFTYEDAFDLIYNYDWGQSYDSIDTEEYTESIGYKIGMASNIAHIARTSSDQDGVIEEMEYYLMELLADKVSALTNNEIDVKNEYQYYFVKLLDGTISFVIYSIVEN